MEKDDILQKVNEIMSDVFDDDTIESTRETVASDIDDWDSVNHLQLMSEIEDQFDISLSMSEVQGFSNVGELVDTIDKHIADEKNGH